ncbi:winged helix DNA-binding domain-containing protein [Nocardioides euryhalodurans]|uniref:Winged helix DNA-binding domain-containing protein n=1 Tax=Nocardioides euryhalodurans TaxID=2518370 RepID=A0A4P7GNY9_9ACTN|nr:winged helix DNA-binding domain-containing protein [Nocardioides euryhalodurans]QBR93946.1 winged helix DNA-binding domain-containing protein [Nocardioides euryhalodurans]
MRHVPDSERRARLVRRHAIAPDHRVGDAVAATRAMVVLHATEPHSVHLSVAARVDGVTVADVDTALYEDRSLVKQLAMRRTLFVFPRDLLPAAWGSASARVAETERKKIGRDVVVGGLATDGEAWLGERRTEVLALLESEGALGAQAIRERLPALDAKVSASPASAKWGTPLPVAPRVLTWLGARGEIVRGVNGGHWRISRPRWTPMAAWLGEVPEPTTEADGYAELVGRWLARFGPGTETDLAWWLGGTKGAVRRALADLDAVEVSLDGGGTGWVLPDDVDPADPEPASAALLPTLDPTTMGWKERDFYLHPDDVRHLVDSAGNAGTTAWWDGRVVGCWVQDDDGRVQVVLRSDPGRTARAALDREAARLTAWLDGQVIGNIYKSQLMKGAVLP